LIGRQRANELLEEGQRVLANSSRRQFLMASALAAGFLSSMWAQRSTGVLSKSDLSRSLSAFDKRTLSLTASTVKSREEYLGWLGVKKVQNPTYERYIVQTPLPAVDSTKLSFGKLTEAEQKAMDERWPPRQAQPGKMDNDTRLIYEFGNSLRVIDGALGGIKQKYRPVSEVKLPVTDKTQMSFLMKKFGTLLGAGYIGITKTKPNIHISTSEKEYYENTVVIAEPQPIRWSRAAVRPGNSSHFSSPTSFYGYARMSFINQTLTEFIRGLGYNAYGHGTTGIFLVPMAIDAGVGEAGRIARVVAPDYGAAMRLSALTTDLPLEPDSPLSFNMHEFCMRCEICADVCPANVRPRGPPGPPTFSLNRPGMNYWYDRVGCRAYWGHGGNEWSSCFRCHAFCPWSEPRTWYHDLARWAAINMGNTGIDILVSMAKADLRNLEVNPATELWNPEVPAYPVGRSSI
jgi:ferredoxin